MLGHLPVFLVREGAEDGAAERMVGVQREDVLAREQGFYLRPRFRFGERVGAGAPLFVILTPAVGILAIHVEAVQGTRYLALEPVVVLEETFPVYAVVSGPGLRLVGAARDHEPGVFTGDAPLAVPILDAHLDDVSVIVEVFGVEAIFGLGLGPGAGARAQGVRGREVAFGAVGGEAGEDVERALVQEAGYEVVFAVAL